MNSDTQSDCSSLKSQSEFTFIANSIPRREEFSIESPVFTRSKYITELNPNGRVTAFHERPSDEINLTYKRFKSCDNNDTTANVMENVITENPNMTDNKKLGLKRKRKNSNRCYNACNQRTTSKTIRSEVLGQYENAAERTTECSLWYRCPKKWTTEMITFYTKLEEPKPNLNYVKVSSAIGDDYHTSPADWALNPLEVSGCLSKAYSCLICTICYELGHTRQNCSEKPWPKVCILCGMQGHKSRKCTKKLCLSCGTPQVKLTKTCRDCEPSHTSIKCNICGADDHIPRFCTESWRKFHSTISTVQE